jgi:hypothetical protein
MMISDTVSIMATISALKQRLSDLEKISLKSKMTLRTHEMKLQDSATLIEVEASSLIKADRSQIQSLRKASSLIKASLGEKIDMSVLKAEIDTVTTARRRALKSLQMDMNILKNRFDGAVEDLVLQFGAGIKKELLNRPTKKEMNNIVSDLTTKINLLEQNGSKKKKKRPLSHNVGNNENQMNGQQRSNGDDVDHKVELRFNDDEEDNAEFSDEEEEREREVKERKRVNNKMRQLNDLATQRHDMFLALQGEVLSMKMKQNVIQGQLDSLEMKQRNLINWKEKEIQPLLTSLKDLVEEYDIDRSNGKRAGSHHGGSGGTSWKKIEQLNNHVQYLIDNMKELKDNLNQSNIDRKIEINLNKKEYYTNLSKLERDILKCKDGIDSLEEATHTLDGTTKEINNDILDLWNLANQTSLDLQTSERIRKGKAIKERAAASVFVSFKTVGITRPKGRVTSAPPRRRTGPLGRDIPGNYLSPRGPSMNSEEDDNTSRPEQLPLPPEYNPPPAPQEYYQQPANCLTVPKPAFTPQIRHEMWRQRSMLNNPSKHVYIRRKWIKDRPKSAAAANNRNTAGKRRSKSYAN